MNNALVSTKHFFKVILQLSRIGLIIRPIIQLFINGYASRYFDGKYFVRGSFGTKNWIPFVSDIDLNIVGKTFTQNQKKIKKQLYSLNQKTRIDISVKFTTPELEKLTYQAGLYYHHNQPWKKNRPIAKRRNLWLCLREVINRYPEHARSKSNFIYIPNANKKEQWMELASEIGLKHIAEKITTEECVRFGTRFSAKACEEIFWANYFYKFSIIKGMPSIVKYLELNQENESLPLDTNSLMFNAINFNSSQELRDYYSEKTNITPFPRTDPALHAFLPKIGISSVKHDSSNVPKLAILQWALESIVVFYDNPYTYEFDPASQMRLEDCIYRRLPLLNKILNQIEMPIQNNKKLNDHMIQQQYILAEALLKQAMQLNNLLT